MADPYDSELEWWFNCGDALLGEKGNLSSTISALERGGANIGVFVDPKEDWTPLDWHHHHEAMDRERRLRARFLTLPKADQRVLVAYYGTSALKQRKPSAKGVHSEDCRPKSRVLAARLQRRGARASRSGCQVIVAHRPGCPKLSCQL